MASNYTKWLHFLEQESAEDRAEKLVTIVWKTFGREVLPWFNNV